MFSCFSNYPVTREIKLFKKSDWVFYSISTEYLLVGLSCITFGFLHLHFPTHKHPPQLNTHCQTCIDFYLYLCISILYCICICTSCTCVVPATSNRLLIPSGIHSVHKWTSSWVHRFIHLYVFHSWTNIAESMLHPFICICI